MKLIPGETEDTQTEELFIVYLRALYGLSGIKDGSLDLLNVELNVKANHVPLWMTSSRLMLYPDSLEVLSRRLALQAASITRTPHI